MLFSRKLGYVLSKSIVTEDAIIKATFWGDFELVTRLLVESPTKASQVLEAIFYKKLKRTVVNYRDIAKFDAIRFDDREKQFIKFLLDLNVDINQTAFTSPWDSLVNISHFSFACRFATFDIFQLMLQHNPDFHLNNATIVYYPIQFAFQSGQDDKINVFLNRGIASDDVNRLHLLNYYVQSKFASLDTVVKLLQLGADVNVIGEDRASSLNCAVQGGNLQIIKALIERGAIVNRFVDQQISELRMAVESRNFAIVKLFLDHGADVNLGRQSPLNKAAEIGDQEIVQLLLDNGANINGNGFGPYQRTTPIDCAALNGHDKLVELLLNRGAEHNESLMMNAVVSRKVSVVELLADRGFDVNSVISSQRFTTLICLAVQRSTKEVVEFLLDRGARIDDGRSPDGYPLHYAAASFMVRDQQMLQFLLDLGADVNVQHGGKTPLSMMVGRVKDRDFYERSMTLIRHLVTIKSQNLHVSEVNLQCIRENARLDKFKNDCESEIELLKGKMFDDSYLSYHDVLVMSDGCKLAALANNKSIVKVRRAGLRREFPIYGQEIVERFNRATLKGRNFDFVKGFFNYLCTRETDRLPRLPVTFICDLFNRLSDRDVSKLKKLFVEN